MQKVGYIFFRILVFTFSLIPFWALYIYSDILYFFFFRVFGYRKKVVFSNLKNSFPEKTDAEILKIAKGFYKNLSDITLESIKGLSMRKKTLLKRYKVINPELDYEYFDKGIDVIGSGSHFANWEWGVLCFSLQFKHKTFGLYKPLSNKYIDMYVRKARAAWGMHLVPINETGKHFSEKQDKPSMHIMVSDQSPSNLKKARWFEFLNQDTPWLHGMEDYAKRFNFPILHGDVQRVKRGYYEIEMKLLEANPQQTKDSEITKKYAALLEEIIRKKPENWLWSHKRWKHKRTES